MSRVLLVDSEQGVTDFLALSLREEGHAVDVVRSQTEAHAALSKALPDVLLIGHLTGQRALQLTRRLRAQARTRDLPLVVMVGGGDDQSERRAAFDAGADDCVDRPCSLHEVLKCIRGVLLGKSPQAVALSVEVGGLRLDPTTRRVSHAGCDIHMGPTEFRLLHFLLTYPERVHSREQLLGRIWDGQDDIAERTVDVHIKRLRQNLATAGAAHLVETVRGVGYRLSALAQAPQVAAASATTAAGASAPAVAFVAAQATHTGVIATVDASGQARLG